MRILLAEDDPAQLEPLYAALSQAGHIVDGVEDGETAQWLLSQKEYDLLILDWLLPQVSGLSLCQQYRQAGKTSPVLILTAKDTTVDKVTGLDAGADELELVDRLLYKKTTAMAANVQYRYHQNQWRVRLEIVP